MAHAVYENRLLTPVLAYIHNIFHQSHQTMSYLWISLHKWFQNTTLDISFYTLQQLKLFNEVYYYKYVRLFWLQLFNYMSSISLFMIFPHVLRIWNEVLNTISVKHLINIPKWLCWILSNCQFKMMNMGYHQAHRLRYFCYIVTWVYLMYFNM